MASSSVLKEHITKLTQYKPPVDGRNCQEHVLLDFNERTVPVAPHVVQAMKDYLDEQSLQMYPAYGDLHAEIAAYAEVPPDQCMFTNGSDQGIDLVIRCCCNKGDEAIIPQPTFGMYEQAALAEGLVIKSPSFTEAKGFPIDEVLAAIGPKTSLVVFCNPNNPTGTAIAREDILKVAGKAPQCAILVDECYYEFMPPECTVKNDLADYRNIFLTRTFSKTWGFASLRIGYLMSAKENVDALSCVRTAYDVNTLAVVALRAAFKDSKYVFDFVDEVMQKSKPAFEDFLRRRNIRFWPSSCNFIFCYFEQPNELESKLRNCNILVRPKNDADGVLGLRVSLGTMEQTSRLISELENILPDADMNGCANGHPAKKPKLQFSN